MKKFLLILAAMVFGLGLIPASAQNYNFNIGGLQYSSGPSVPASCSRPGSYFYKTTATKVWNICNGSTYDAMSVGGSSSGTVTSASFTGGLVSVATPTTTPAFTVAGTSGGIPFFDSASTWNTSALLASNSPVLGGGAGATPKTATFLTTNGTAELDIGIAGGGNGVIGLKGNTSGTATCAAPAIAGTILNPVICSNALELPASSGAGSPSLTFVGGTSSGIGWDSSALRLNFSYGGGYSMSISGNIMTANSSGVWGFTSSSANNAADTGMSRDAAGVVDFGTGAQGNTAGTIQAQTHNTLDGSFGSKLSHTVTACETAFATTTLATGATTTDTGLNCLPANSIIDAVTARVTTTITAACTGWELGDATTAARFTSNNTTLTAGTTTDAAHIGTYVNTGIASVTTGIWQAAAAKVRITCAGGNPGAGAVRVIVYSHAPAAPTS